MVNKKNIVAGLGINFNKETLYKFQLFDLYESWLESESDRVTFVASMFDNSKFISVDVYTVNDGGDYCLCLLSRTSVADIKLFLEELASYGFTGIAVSDLELIAELYIS